MNNREKEILSAANAKNLRWYTNLLDGESEYCIGGVRYTVGHHFFPFLKSQQINLREKMENLLQSDFVDLTAFETPNILEGENVCSVAGKEQ